MLRYLSENAGLSENRASRSYPNLRYDFRPRAYVVLTREIEAQRSDRDA
jgi:hypothetical protein